MVQLTEVTKHKPAVSVMLLFAAVYASISFVNHYLFRTYSFDLGLYNHTLFDYSQFRFNDSLLIEPIHRQRNQLSDHFDLMLMLLSPLRYVFGTYTLLIVQWVAVVTGGFGIYILARQYTEKYALLAMIHFYVMWGIYSALAFDYHSNVVAAMLVPWLFYFFKKENLKGVFIISVLIAICKENMAFWLSFILMGLALLPETSKRFKVIAAILSLVFLGYFMLVVKWIMPSLMPPGLAYIHLTFGQLGSGLGEIIVNALRDPVKMIRLLFESPYDDPATHWIKTELHIFTLLSGGVLLLFRPQFLIMLIPIYAQKLFHDDIVKWGINLHYSIELIPLISICSLTLIARTPRFSPKVKTYLYAVLIVLSAGLTLRSFSHRISKWFEPTTVNFLSSKHYKQTFDVQKVHHIIGQIPDNYSLAASPNLTPHLAFRRIVYSFPMWQNVEVIALLKTQESYFPYNREKYEREIASLKSGAWGFRILFEDDELIVLGKPSVYFDINR